MAEGAVRLVVAADPVGRAAELVAEALATQDRSGAGVRLAIPGGSALAVAIAARGLVEDSLWARLRLVWTDERCVGAGEPDSNAGSAERAGLFERGRPRRVLRLWEEGEDAAAALERVEAALERDFGGALDVALLGMGADGHFASLFPGRPPLPGAVALVPDSPKPPARRVTLTRAFLASAAACFVVAWGAEKGPALERLLAGDPALPASGLPGLVLVTDRQPG